MARALRAKGERVGAAAAFARSVAASLADAELMAVAELQRTDRYAEAIAVLDNRLRADGDDIVALRMAADQAAQAGRPVDAERDYRRCIDLCPSYLAARHGLCRLMLHQARLGEASVETEYMLAAAPADPSVRMLKAAVAASVGDHDDAAGLYQGLVGELPHQPALWLGLGHSHRTSGRAHDAIAAYRRAVDIPSGAAEAYWSLSNLKTYRFDDEDLRRMSDLAGDATGQRAAHVHFAQGQAFDARGDTDRAFDAFARGNAAKRAVTTYDAGRAGRRLEHWTAGITVDLMAAEAGKGDPSSAPIFVVGLPRSGSTLVEQILSSHSLIENTAELPYMDRIATRVARSGFGARRERAMPSLEDADLSALGHEYLSAARAHRKSAKPFFIDKLPGNFAHIGLIKLILPNATIIDVRRHPLATVWSVFKQLFAQGQPFAYDLVEIAHWYRGYVAAMARFDTVLPGRFLTMAYEELVTDTEAQVRRLLDHVGLAFEPGCLAFHENGNAVRTPSSEQVRRPIFRHALTDWERYREHLSQVENLLAVELDGYHPAGGAGGSQRISDPDGGPLQDGTARGSL